MILLLLSPSKLFTAPRREDPTPLTALDMNMEDNKPEKTPPEHRTMGENGKKFLPEISLTSLSSFEGKKLSGSPVLLQTQDYHTSPFPERGFVAVTSMPLPDPTTELKG